MSRIVMSWSECSIVMGKTGTADAMADTLVSVGTIKDKSTSMETAQGEKMEARATGGKLVGYETGQGVLTLTTRIIEPDFASLATMIDATNNTEAGELTIKSLLVNDQYSIKVSPKNIGGTGIRARKCHIEYKEGYSESEGHFADLKFTVMTCADGELYTKFKKLV